MIAPNCSGEPPCVSPLPPDCTGPNGVGDCAPVEPVDVAIAAGCSPVAEEDDTILLMCPDTSNALACYDEDTTELEPACLLDLAAE